MYGGMIGMLLQNEDGNLRFVVTYGPVEIKVDGAEIPVRLESCVISEIPDATHVIYSNPDDIINAVEALIETFSGKKQKRQELLQEARS